MEGITPDYWIEHQDECHEKLKENWNKLPFLGSVPIQFLKEGQIVRFRGMIQDMLDPLLYFTKIEALNTITNKKEMVYGKYKECSFFDKYEEIDGDLMVDQERRPYYCISIPGLNDWAQQIEEPLLNEMDSSDSLSEDGAKSNEEIKFDSDGALSKRALEESSGLAQALELGSKRRRTSTVSNESDSEMDVYYPIKSKNNYACVVTLYDTEDAAVSLNEIIEAVGFLWHASPHTDMPEDMEPSLPPLVPRLHAVAFKKIDNVNPLVTPDLDISSLFLEGPSLRSDLHLALTQLMLGDSLAADYLLCNIISTVYKRRDLMALGKLTINFSNVPVGNGFTEGFYSIISHLVPKSHYIPFSLQAMNALRLLPEKDYEKNRLKAGVLQLSNQTHIIIDETKLDVGRLEETGVKNVKAINNMVIFQRLGYNLIYHTMDFITDFPIITLSEGKSMLHSDVEVVIDATRGCTGCVEESLEAVREFLNKEPLLTKLRQFISLTTTIDFNIPPEILNEVEKDFVDMRQERNSTTVPDDLHILLVVARLLSLSRGMNTLTREMWRRACSMERARKLRIQDQRQ